MNKKVRTEVRLDSRVHARLKGLAEVSGLSLNQVMEGLLTWGAANGYPGHPDVWECEDRGVTCVGVGDHDAQVAWFGKASEAIGPDGEGGLTEGVVAFVLDYSGTRAVVPWPEVEDATEEG